MSVQERQFGTNTTGVHVYIVPGCLAVPINDTCVFLCGIICSTILVRHIPTVGQAFSEEEHSDLISLTLCGFMSDLNLCPSRRF